MISLQLDKEGLDKYMRAMEASGLSANELLRQMVNNLEIHRYIADDSVVLETSAQEHVWTVDKIGSVLNQLIVDLEYAKSADRTKKDRYLAIVITNLELLTALFEKHVAK